MITDGTRIRYSGSAWSLGAEANVHCDEDETYVALDGIDTTERGSFLVVVKEDDYGSEDENDHLIISNGSLEFIEVIS